MLETEELDTFIEYIYQKSGYDFRNYAPASLARRVALFKTKHRFERLRELQAALGAQEALMRQFIENMTVQVTEMFRDPLFYRTLALKVFDHLKTYPRIKIWHAGCSNGAEVYSMAILLEEHGLLSRSRIYATDINEDSLKQAYDGVFPLADMQKFTRNYQQSGLLGNFADYYRADNVSAIIDQKLRQNVTFAFHNLATDWVFTEAHLIVCRNVLIYFDRKLQDRVLDLFQKSLVRRGVLALGSKENLRFSKVADDFEVLDAPAKIFRMKS